jgi:hypothetical protein
MMIVAGIAIVVLGVLALLSYNTFHKAPTCADGIQNQGEEGVDCGGPCPYLCTPLEAAPVVEFTEALPNARGTTDLIAYIDNPNQDAYAANVPYSISLYSAANTLGAPVQTGVIDLPPGALVPVFIPNVTTGKNPITSAFLTIDPTVIKWRAGRDTRIVPQVANITLSGKLAAPRITAILQNPSTATLSNVRVVVVVFNPEGNAESVSQTIVPSIPPQEGELATFTWTAPFAEPATRIDVLPVIPLAGAQ